MPVTVLPQQQGLFEAFSQQFQQQFQQEQNLAMQEKQLGLEKERVGLQAKDLENRAQEQQFQQQQQLEQIQRQGNTLAAFAPELSSLGIDPQSAAQMDPQAFSTVMQSVLGLRAQGLQERKLEADITNSDRLFGLETRAADLATERLKLDETIAGDISERDKLRIGQQDVQLGISQQRLDFEKEATERAFFNDQAFAVQELSGALGVPAEVLNRTMFGEGLGNPEAIQALDRAAWEAAGSPGFFVEFAVSQRLDRAFGAFGVAAEQRQIIEEKLAGSTVEAVLNDFLKDPDETPDDKATLFSILKLAFPEEIGQVQTVIEPSGLQQFLISLRKIGTALGGVGTGAQIESIEARNERARSRGR